MREEGKERERERYRIIRETPEYRRLMHLCCLTGLRESIRGRRRIHPMTNWLIKEMRASRVRWRLEKKKDTEKSACNEPLKVHSKGPQSNDAAR